ncbi:PP2C family protein-serine/threonine phosphatase [Streptomyces sp. NPDC086766]|uniref:PP2C family protein-serine/threonine phosphatase n=1 Tax=Streptomyces sp. NPDC086766 TaxID=3365754 RepID=UPI0037FA2456
MRDVIGRLAGARVWRHPATVTVALSLLPVILLVVDVLTPEDVRFGALMVAAPALAAIFCSPTGVLVVIAVTLPCVVGASAANDILDSANFPTQLGTITLISVAALAASAVRMRREQELARSRWVAQVTQRVLLHPLPRKVGTFDLASLYLAADEEAAIGGDLYAVARCGSSARILLGDVQGKGLAALEMVSSVLNTFRHSVRHGSPLPEVVRELETSFREEMRELCEAADAAPGPGTARYADQAAGAGVPYATDVVVGAAVPYGADAIPSVGSSPGEESFVTAVVVELPDDGPMRLVNLGHPPPLLLHDGTVRALEPKVPVPPLGLADLNGGDIVVEEADFPPGAVLLLYTDGVTEARGPSGAFYPLADRLRRWTALPPDALLTAVHADLRRYVGGARLADDVAMVAVRRSPTAVAATPDTDPDALTDALLED